MCVIAVDILNSECIYLPYTAQAINFFEIMQNILYFAEKNK